MRYGKYIDTGMGRLYLAQEDGYIVQAGGGSASDGDRIQDTRLLLQAQEEIAEYFAGKRRSFTVPFRAAGTDFQERVWQALLQIPYGETRTYGQIAVEAGSPKGARAVGMACNRNPVMILIPCHRVIGSDGSLTGFGGGLPMKEYLLRIEKEQ